MWRVLTLIALWWPSHLAGLLDGAPLDRVPEALLLGLILPALIWAHPAFLRKVSARVAIVAIIVIKASAAMFVQQTGWCVTFEPPYAMVRDSTGKPHSWDVRADWFDGDPACSAIMTRAYRDTGNLPVWFYNLPPPDDAVTRGSRFSPGEIPVRMRAAGYLTARTQGEFDLQTAPLMDVALRVDGMPVETIEPAHHHVALPRGRHVIQFEGTLLGKDWRVIPRWNGTELGSMFFPLITLAAPSRLDRALIPAADWVLTILIAAFAAAWSWSAIERVRRSRAFDNFLMIVILWLAYIAGAHARDVGHWTLYGIGNDDFQFQRFSYRIFMQQYWLEGGQVTFWNQPFYRWIAGALHMLFGDSSVGQAFFDAAGVAIFMLFAYRVVKPLAGFKWGLFAALTPLVMFLVGPALRFVGFGLSEISSAGFIYFAALYAMRNRGIRDAFLCGVLVTLGFYTRLNNLPMAVAVAAFALPLSVPAGDWWRVRAWLPAVHWRIVVAIAAALIGGSILFAWRTWYYTGIFSMFYGTQREYLAVWKPGMTFGQALPMMISSVMMVLSGQDPARLTLVSMPLLGAAGISAAALAGIRGVRRAPLSLVLFFLGGVSGALITRGWAYEGRFSIHLYASAAALCVWSIAVAVRLKADPHIDHAPSH